MHSGRPAGGRGDAAAGRSGALSALRTTTGRSPRGQIAITVEPTHRCPRRCSFCYLHPERARASEELPARDLAALVGALAAHTGCDHIQVSGGEPLLYPELDGLIAAFRRAGLGVSLLSDLGLLDPARARALVRLGVRKVQPTLLGGHAAVHDLERGAGSFCEITRGIATAQAAGLAVTVSQVLLRSNQGQAAAVAELAFALGARSMALSRFCPAGAAADRAETLLPDPAAVAADARAAAAACRRHGLPLAVAVTLPRCVFEPTEPPPLRLGGCALVSDRVPLTVGPDGSLRSCALDDTPVGHLGREPLPALLERLQTSRVAPLARATLPACAGCAAAATCRGGCRLAALAVTGHADAPDPLARPASGPRASSPAPT